ncbi:MAG: PAS domain S-box protein [Gammaproteobacteria bacterium]|nr:PAS domain S-box protein [Gammaproteobacteria bacterium]
MDAFIEAIVIINDDGKIERFNSTAEKMFGYKAEQIKGKDVSMLMPSPDGDRHDNYLERYLRTGNAHIIGLGREVQALRRDGSTFTAHLAIGEVGWHGERRFVGMLRDLTDTKAAEERTLRQHQEMINASRLTTMGEMAAAMAHEINQPLSAIANYASASLRMLKNPDDNREDIKKALERIGTQAHRAGEIIRRLRSFVRPANINLEVVNIASVIDEIMPLAELDARANNISLKIDVPRDLPEIVADQLQIQQVILNLLRNGVDAMKDSAPEDRQLRMNAYSLESDEIRIDIIDRGQGVPEDAKDYLFDPFFSTKSHGMGMGLAICQTIAKAHSGRLAFLKNPVIGTTFSISLPTKVH